MLDKSLKDIASKYMTEVEGPLFAGPLEDKLLMYPDMSQIEIKIMAELMKAERAVRRTVIHGLATAADPVSISEKLAKLRKSRARMLLLALHTLEPQERGNIRIVPARLAGEVLDIMFYYRGTQIAEWTPVTGEFNYVHCREFEDTHSTRNQRRMIDEAIKEFEKEIMPNVVSYRDDSVHCLPDLTATEEGK